VPIVVQVFINIIASSDTLGPLIQLHKFTPPTVVSASHAGTVCIVIPNQDRKMWNRPRASLSHTTGGHNPKVIVFSMELIVPSLWYMSMNNRLIAIEEVTEGK
jgi:hypothetical protein